MNTTKLATLTVALSASFFLCLPGLQAQDAAATTAPSASPVQSAVPAPGGGGAADFMKQIMAARDNNIKTALGSTDEEWTVIQPLLDKVEQAQLAFVGTANFGFGFGGRRGGNGGGGSGGAGGPGRGGNPLFQTSPEAQALSDAIQSGTASNDDLKAKMAAVRDARKKATDNLAAARADLQKVLSLHQEAVLLSMGILD